mmetsp:Transcript_40566/g.97982  ORF Transcript_40566/g.97982 Transcript_40566/m.97982 type:complete len:342 (+) Transcript_40566:766-1791(+)
MGGSIFSQTNRVMRKDIQDSKLTECRQTNGTRHVSSKCQKGSTIRPKSTIGKETIAQCPHGMFADTKSNVTTLWSLLLKIHSTLKVSQVGGSQIGRSTHQFNKVWTNGIQTFLTHLASRQILVLANFKFGKLVKGAFWNGTRHATFNFGSLGRMGRLVFGKHVVPVCHLGSILGNDVIKVLLNVFWDIEHLVFGESIEFLGSRQIVLSKRSTVSSMSSFLGRRSVSNLGLDGNNRWLVSRLLSLFDCGSQVIQLSNNIRDFLNMPSVGFITLLDIFGKGQIGGSINGNVIVVIQDNQFAKTQMSRQTAGFSRNTFLETTISANHIGIIVKDLVFVGIVRGS